MMVMDRVENLARVAAIFTNVKGQGIDDYVLTNRICLL